jgi:hypothetical protein
MAQIIALVLFIILAWQFPWLWLVLGILLCVAVANK